MACHIIGWKIDFDFFNSIDFKNLFVSFIMDCINFGLVIAATKLFDWINLEINYIIKEIFFRDQVVVHYDYIIEIIDFTEGITDFNCSHIVIDYSYYSNCFNSINYESFCIILADNSGCFN